MKTNLTVDRLLFNLSSKKQIEYKDIKLCIQDYLHYINSVNDTSTKAEVESLFTAEPKMYSNIPKNVYAYIAAIVEKLTKDFKLYTPEWIYKKVYYLENPWFPPEIEKYEKIKEIMKKVSPEAFKSRNLFVSEDAIVVM
jgi:hypothetical protein